MRTPMAELCFQHLSCREPSGCTHSWSRGGNELEKKSRLKLQRDVHLDLDLTLTLTRTLIPSPTRTLVHSAHKESHGTETHVVIYILQSRSLLFQNSLGLSYMVLEPRARAHFSLLSIPMLYLDTTECIPQ